MPVSILSEKRREEKRRVNMNAKIIIMMCTDKYFDTYCNLL